MPTAALPLTAVPICPQCGARLNYDPTCCWLCANKSFPGATGPAWATVVEKPSNPPATGRTPVGSIVGFVLSVLLLTVSIPVAAIIALFCVCVASASQGNLYRNDNLETVILLGGGAFVVVTTLFMLSIYFSTKMVR